MWYNENNKHNERAKNGIWSEALANGRFYRFPIASTQPRLRGETYPHRGLNSCLDGLGACSRSGPRAPELVEGAHWCGRTARATNWRDNFYKEDV